jgi:hypothetical protein
MLLFHLLLSGDDFEAVEKGTVEFLYMIRMGFAYLKGDGSTKI